MPFDYGPDFWYSVIDDMNRHNFDKIMHVLHDIRYIICYIVPNQREAHKQIQSDIPLPYIKQQFLKETYDIHMLDTLFCIILEWIDKVDPTFKVRNDKWIIQINSNISTCINKNMSYMTCLPIVLGGIHTKLVKLIEK